jgi:hypothetical protein
MELNKLYDLTEKENIKIYSCHIKNCNGIFLNYDNINAIALNYDEFETYVEEKCTLAHELGHYYTNATYSLYSDQSFIDKQEYKAFKWQSLTCVPLKSILSCFYKRYMQFVRYCRRIASNPKYGRICL